MSVSYETRVVLGILVKREEFFVTKGTKRVCRKGHEHPAGVYDGAEFCPKDGSKYEPVNVEEPTPGFAEYCAKQNEKPEALFRRLFNADGIGLHAINASQSNEDDDDEVPMALGCLIMTVNEHTGQKPCGLYLNKARDMAEEIAATHREIGISYTTREVKIYACLYVSI